MTKKVHYNQFMLHNYNFTTCPNCNHKNVRWRKGKKSIYFITCDTCNKPLNKEQIDKLIKILL